MYPLSLDKSMCFSNVLELHTFLRSLNLACQVFFPFYHDVSMSNQNLWIQRKGLRSSEQIKTDGRLMIRLHSRLSYRIICRSWCDPFTLSVSLSSVLTHHWYTCSRVGSKISYISLISKNCCAASVVK